MLRSSRFLLEAVRVITPLLILAIGAAAFVELKKRAEVPVQDRPPKGAPVVDTAAVVPHAGVLTIESDGQVVPYREITLSAEVAGRVVQKADVCQEGRFVRKGEVLLKIDPRDYDLEKQRLEEELVQAGVQLRELAVEVENTRALLDLATEDVQIQESEWKRQKELLDRHATSPADVDRAKRSLLQARNAELTLRNQMNLLNTRRDRLASVTKLTQVRLNKAELDLTRTEVTSPVDGVVVVESVEVDSFVQRGASLVTIEDTSAVEVRCSLRMDELYWVWNQERDGDFASGTPERDYQLPETPVTVVYKLHDREYEWEGVLCRYDGIGLDERTRTVPCRVLVESPQDVRVHVGTETEHPRTGPPALVRGMFVALRLHATPTARLLQVPEIAVQPGNRVLRVRNNRLNAVDVEVVAMTDGVATVQTESGQLDVGDEVVVSPMAEAVDDMVVQSHRVDVATVAAVDEETRAGEVRER